MAKEYEDNLTVDVDPQDLEMVEDYRKDDKLEPDFFPLITYDLVQSGYPAADHGVMIPRVWSGSNAAGQLVSGKGAFCRTEDVKRLIAELTATKDQ